MIHDYIEIESYSSAYVSLNVLNVFTKIDQMRGLLSILLLFYDERSCIIKFIK